MKLLCPQSFLRQVEIIRLSRLTDCLLQRLFRHVPVKHLVPSPCKFFRKIHVLTDVACPLNGQRMGVSPYKLILSFCA
jgi:hypothetical protein